VSTEDEPEVADVYLADGECVIFDPDYLDPACEAQGVLGMQYSVDRGLWVLVGEGEGVDYTQQWRAVGAEASKPGKKLRPV